MLGLVRLFQSGSRKKPVEHGNGRTQPVYDPGRLPSSPDVQPSKPAAPVQRPRTFGAWIGRFFKTVGAALGLVIGAVVYVLFHIGAAVGRWLLNLAMDVLTPLLRLAAFGLIIGLFVGWFGVQPAVLWQGCREGPGGWTCPGSCLYGTATGWHGLRPGVEVSDPCPIFTLRRTAPHGPLTWF